MRFLIVHISSSSSRLAWRTKNWLFAGSEEGAERACVLYSVLATCKMHGVNPWEYLRDVLARVGDHPARDILALTPRAWNEARENLDAAKSG